MKYNILKLISFRNDIDCHKFVKSIALKKRNISILKDDSFDVKILATAAPSYYANIIANNEHFSVCLGTDFDELSFSNTFENIKEVKKNSVINYLSSKNLTNIDVFITDHIDDLPLMKLAKKSMIVNPNDYMITELKRHNISFEVIS